MEIKLCSIGYFDRLWNAFLFEVAVIGLLIAAAAIITSFVLAKLEFSYTRYKDAAINANPFIEFQESLKLQRKSERSSVLCQRDANFNDEKNSLVSSELVNIEEQNISEDTVDAATTKTNEYDTTKVKVERSAEESKGLGEAYCECEMCVNFDRFKYYDETWTKTTHKNKRKCDPADINKELNQTDMGACRVESRSNNFQISRGNTGNDIDSTSRQHDDYTQLNIHDSESQSNSWYYISESLSKPQNEMNTNVFKSSQQTAKSSFHKFDLVDYDVCKVDTGGSYKYSVSRNSESPVVFNIRKDIKIPEPENVPESNSEAFDGKRFPMLRSYTRDNSWSPCRTDASNRLSTYSETSVYSNESTIPSEFTCRICEPIDNQSPSVAMATNFHSSSKLTSSTIVSSLKTRSSRLAAESGYMSSGGEAGTSGSEAPDPNESWMDRYKSRHRKMLMRHHRSYVIGKRRVRRYLEEKMRLSGHARGNANKLDPPVPHPPEAMPNVQRHFGLATWKELVKSCSENHEVYQNGSIKASLLDSSPSFMVKKCKIRRKQYARRKLRVNVDFVVNPTGSATGELSGAVTLPVTCLMVRGQGPRIMNVGRPVLKNER